jgi:hypothetical protein
MHGWSSQVKRIAYLFLVEPTMTFDLQLGTPSLKRKKR